MWATAPNYFRVGSIRLIRSSLKVRDLILLVEVAVVLRDPFIEAELLVIIAPVPTGLDALRPRRFCSFRSEMRLSKRRISASRGPRRSAMVSRLAFVCSRDGSL